MTALQSVLQGSPEAGEALVSLASERCDPREFGAQVMRLAIDALMSAEADARCGAAWGERGDARANSRNGCRRRSLKTALGDLELDVPKLRRGTYYPESVLSRWSRAEASPAALVVEAYVNGVSTRDMSLLAESLGVSSLPASEVSRLTAELGAQVGGLRSRRLDGRRCRCLWVDAAYVRCRVGGPLGLPGRGHGHRPGRGRQEGARRAWLRGHRELRGLEGVPGLGALPRPVRPGAVRLRRPRRPGARARRGLPGGRLAEAHGAPAAQPLREGALGEKRAPGARARQGRLRGRGPPRLQGGLRPRLRGDARRRRGRLRGAAGGGRGRRPAVPLASPGALAQGQDQQRAGEGEPRIKRRYRSVQAFPSRESLLRLVGAVMLEEGGGRWHHRVFSPESTALAWEAPSAPAPDGALARAVAEADRRAEALVASVVDRWGSEA